MKKAVLIFVVLILCISAFFSGCTQGKPVSKEMPKFQMNKQNEKAVLSSPPGASPIRFSIPPSSKYSEEKLSSEPTLGQKLLTENKMPDKNAVPTRVPILIYHSISDIPIGLKQLSVCERDFEKQISYIKEQGYTPIFFSELKDFKTFRKPIIITFDDGYEDNYSKAYPILIKYNCKATIFLIANTINKPGYLSEKEIAEMEGLVSFQSHTLSHPELDKVSNKRLEKELMQSKEIISAITKEPVYVLSYPCGAFNSRVLKAAERCYDYAVSTKYGYYKTDSGHFNIHRIQIRRSFSLSNLQAQ